MNIEEIHRSNSLLTPVEETHIFPLRRLPYRKVLMDSFFSYLVHNIEKVHIFKNLEKVNPNSLELLLPWLWTLSFKIKTQQKCP